MIMLRQSLAACRSYGVDGTLGDDRPCSTTVEVLAKLLDEVDEKLPGIDLLVNNAGTFIDRPFLEMDFERYLSTMHLNVTSGYFLTQALARRWVAEAIFGRVLFTGSINGFLSEPDHTAYDTSKGAVAAMVRSLCVALAPHGIRVNSMAPDWYARR